MKIITFLLLMTSLLASEYSQRKCTLLPITDNLGGGQGYKVFKKVEEYLLNGSWCYYRYNSDLLNLLQQQTFDDKFSLENKGFIKKVSTQLQVGSIIYITMKKNSNGMEGVIQVIGEKGEDTFFKENISIKSDDPEKLAAVIKRKLDIYSKILPYEARIIGVMGQQFTFDAGQEIKIQKGDKLIIRRPIKKKRHPFLDEIIDWETIKVGEGIVLSSNEQQSLGNLLIMSPNQKLRPFDWIIIERSKGTTWDNKKLTFKSDEDHRFGRIGQVGLYIGQSNGENSIQLNGFNRKLSGKSFGVHLTGEGWLTREFYIKGQYHRYTGSYSPEFGEISRDDNGLQMGRTDLAIGYKLLFLGYFYGPQAYAHGGLGRRSYSYETISSEGMGQLSVTGAYIAAGGNMPVAQGVRVFVEVDSLLNASYQEDIEVYGTSNSVSDYTLKLGLNYLYGARYQLEGVYYIHTTQVSFPSEENDLRFKEKVFHLGALYTF